MTDWTKHLMSEIHELNVNIIQLSKEIERLKFSLNRHSERIESLEVYLQIPKASRKTDSRKKEGHAPYQILENGS